MKLSGSYGIFNATNYVLLVRINRVEFGDTKWSVRDEILEKQVKKCPEQKLEKVQDVFENINC